MCTDQIIDISKAFLTPSIGVVTVYIAWQQMKTNRQRLKFERYDRRLRIYKEVKKILKILVKDSKFTPADLHEFYAGVSEADFLFGHEIRDYIDEIHHHGCELARWHQEYRDCTQPRPEGYDHQEVVNGKKKESSWLNEQFDISTRKFKKYLHI